jgi:hypothetical protein
MKIISRRNIDGSFTQTLLDGRCITMKSNGQARQAIVLRAMEYLERNDKDPGIIWSFVRAYINLDDSSK